MKMLFKKISNNDIRIKFTANGGILVICGCAKLSYGPQQEELFLADLRSFFKDPRGVEAEYNEQGLPEASTDLGERLINAAGAGSARGRL